MNIGADFFLHLSLVVLCVLRSLEAALRCLLCLVPNLPLSWLFLHILRICQGPEDRIGARDLSSMLALCAYDGGESFLKPVP